MATNTQITDLALGSYGDIQGFAGRIKQMMRGGEKLQPSDAMSLAQFASVTGLNPFIGECWWIPGSGAMIGIAGARRLDQQRAIEKGGYSFPVVTSCPYDEAGATEAELKDVVAAFKVEINDSAATAEYQKMLVATIQAMRDAGVEDPFGAAKEICGPRPTWVGYGFSKKTDQSRMNKVQLARKRAEADALKKRIVIPFGFHAQVAEMEVSPEYVDAKVKDTESPDWTDSPGKWDESLETDAKVEEVVIQTTTPAPKAKAPKAEAEKPKGVIGWLVDTHQMNTSHAAQVANLLKLTDPKLTQADWEKRYNNYRSLRDANLSPEEAAKKALAA